MQTPNARYVFRDDRHRSTARENTPSIMQYPSSRQPGHVSSYYSKMGADLALVLESLARFPFIPVRARRTSSESLPSRSCNVYDVLMVEDRLQAGCITSTCLSRIYR